ncbi:Dynamin family protein [Methanoculleus sp. Wushi-C6]|uniref:Dynamin family protein n=1 Tax=Methanoculleus caldifontis TaxID=2651577 RepID=A0ABU3X382_9EURY|nr:dynamin family protein [Methanoculleus sp. Wushi-C6]MDV2482519.1 Dynamin family protein [Methanoculleus sp. Wushi-C6]
MTSHARHLPEILACEADRVQSFGPEYAPYADQLRELAGRLDSGRFHLAVLGQFKRGKSTLINALLGESLLPSSVIPLTAIPTLMTYGDRRSVRIRFQGNRDDEVVEGGTSQDLYRSLLHSVSEEFNPKNERGVLQVEVTHPSPILAEGVVLIDTPGIGSVHQHNTEMTLNFLAQCDAALFLVSADPPITEVEVEFLRTIRDAVTKVFFVLNKVDYLTDDEQKTALAFFETVLRERAGIQGSVTIFPVSAKRGLATATAEDAALWQSSGMAKVSDHLVGFLAGEKNAVLRDAVRRKARAVLGAVALRLDLSRRALEMPLDDLEDRMRTFEVKIREAELQRRHAADILEGDHRRIAISLEEEMRGLRERSLAHLMGVAEGALAGPAGPDEMAAQNAVAAAIPPFYEHELGETTTAVEREVTALLQTHQQRAADLIGSIRTVAADLFEIPYHAQENDRMLSMRQEPYWVSRKGWESTFSPVTNGLVDRALPRSMRARRIRARLEKQISYLVVRNTENLRWATIQNVDATFRQFGRELDADLAEAVDATEGAITAAYTKRREHASETADDLARLQQASGEVASAISSLEQE